LKEKAHLPGISCTEKSSVNKLLTSRKKRGKKKGKTSNTSETIDTVPYAKGKNLDPAAGTP